MTNEEKAHLWVEHASAGVADLDVIEREIVAALTAARREALEEAAEVADDYADVSEHSDKCAHCNDGPKAARGVAAAIRALLPQQGQQQRPYDDTFSAWDAVTAEIARRAGGGDRG